MRPRLLLITLLVPAVVAIGCSGDDTGIDDRPPEWPASIVLGVVPEPEQTGVALSLAPMVAALESRLGIDVELVEAADHDGLVDDILAGRTDFGAVEPFAYTSASEGNDDLVAASQLARFERFTRHGQWFTNDDTVCSDPPVEGTALVNGPDGLMQVSALEVGTQQVGVTFDADGATFAATTSNGSTISPGRSCIGPLEAVTGSAVAFINQGSLAGGRFPALQLHRLGIDHRAAIDPIYTGSHGAAVRAVYDGEARFGVSFDDARRQIADDHPDVGTRVIVFNLTDEIPYEAIVTRRDLPDLLAASVQDALAAYLETGDGAALVERTLGWTDVRSAVESDFDVVREAAALFASSDPEVTTPTSPGSP